MNTRLFSEMMSRMAFRSAIVLSLLHVVRDSQSLIAAVRVAISVFISSMGRSNGSFPALMISTSLEDGDLKEVGGSMDITGDLSSIEDSGERDLQDWKSESNGFGGAGGFSPSVGVGGCHKRRIEGKQPILNEADEILRVEKF